MIYVRPGCLGPSRVWLLEFLYFVLLGWSNFEVMRYRRPSPAERRLTTDPRAPGD
jgi:hypothetical protein